MRVLLPRRSAHRFPRRPLRTALVALIAATGIASCDGGSERDDRRAALEQQRRELLHQFAAAQNRIRHTQAQAMGDSSLIPLRERFYDLLHDRMVAIEPRAEDWLDRARKLGPEIEVLSRPQILAPGEEPVSIEEQRAVVEEFAALEDTLRPVQNRAMADPDVASAFKALQDSLHALMVRINPAAESSLDEMRRTSAAIDSIDALLRELGEA